ncbi:MAG: spermidine synthase, partial [Candidatus Omnitrophota bacterium]
MKKRLVFSLLVMGLSGIVAQILLLRELLIIFCGNELTIGIILANWLIIEAIGAFWVGKRVENILHKLEGFIILQIIFSFSFPLAIYLTRTIREISGIVPGVGLGVGQVFLFSFLVIFPVSISHGALFTYGCKILSLYLPSETEAVGKVYIYETVGTILGGFILTYFLIPYFHSFQIVFWIILINLMFCILLLGKFWQKGKNILTKTLGIITSFLCFLSVVFLLNNGIDRIHNNSIARQWSKYRVKHYQNTFFGNIVVGEKDGALTFFFNGIPVVNLPTPDITCIEEFAHFSLLSHASPQEILIIGRGAGGVINEILKHPVTTVDYLEIDPIFLKILKNFSTPLIAQELDNPKVNTITLDGRFFLRRTEKKYDLILLGFSNPSDLQTNRYFTKEFFSLVRGRLKEEGIFVLSLPGLPRAILNLKEIKDLNACIFNTLKEVYTNIKVIPGEGINLFLASDSEEINLLNAQIFIERLKERKVFASMFNPDYIKYRFQTFWHENFFSSLKGATHRINRDFHPVATFYSLVYWNALFSPYLLKFFRNIENIIPFV